MADVSSLPVDLACADGQKLDSTTLRISSEDHAILKTNLMRTKPFPAPLQFVAEPSWVFTSRKPLDLLFHSLLNFGTEPPVIASKRGREDDHPRQAQRPLGVEVRTEATLGLPLCCRIFWHEIRVSPCRSHVDWTRCLRLTLPRLWPRSLLLESPLGQP